jgi:hypothetical protein
VNNKPGPRLQRNRTTYPIGEKSRGSEELVDLDLIKIQSSCNRHRRLREINYQLQPDALRNRSQSNLHKHSPDKKAGRGN